MTAQFQFGLVVRGQAEQGEDISRRFQETLAIVRLADRLGFDSITKTAHYSAYPFQMLQLVPMLARLAAETSRLRLNAGVLLLPLLSPLHVAEEFATLDVISGGKVILGVGLGYRDVEFKAFGVPRDAAGTPFRGQSGGGQTAVDRGQGFDEGRPFRTRRRILPAEAAATAASADLGRRQCRPSGRAGGPPR